MTTICVKIGERKMGFGLKICSNSLILVLCSIIFNVYFDIFFDIGVGNGGSNMAPPKNWPNVSLVVLTQPN